MKVAIIPARSGSKRLPRKNVLPVLGKPILSYPIAAVKECSLFDDVIVSTDDREIGEAALAAGVRVLKRPVELAADRATVVQVCLHVLEELRNERISPEYFCCVYPTALFIKPEDLRDSFSLMQSEPEADFVMGVSEYSLQPVQALKSKGDFLKAMWPEYLGVQSQFQPKLVASNGTLYWARTLAFFNAKTFYGDKLKGFLIPRIRAVDIDTPEAFRIAEILAPHVLRTRKDSKTGNN